LVAASAESDDILGVREDYERLKGVMQQHAQEQHEQVETAVDLAKKTQISPEQAHLRELVSIIVKMLARQVSDYKIAQTIANRLKPSPDWEDILQVIRMIHDFIGLANAEVFAHLPATEKLPDPADALRILCDKGDNSLCLELLQKLTSQYIDDAMSESGVTRQVLLAQASGYACLTGNFAWFDDMDLAQTSFNFATEISAENVNAWSRLGDIYVAQNNLTKAMFAYQSVMELGEAHLYDQQLANARFRLASYYRTQGMTEKASTYTDLALEYYKQCGLTEPLTVLEDAAADLIISRQDIRESIEILISHLSK
jgi:tetratricopeptide (TPR) repeat protein